MILDHAKYSINFNGNFSGMIMELKLVIKENSKVIVVFH